jgi:hypothetical protein
MKPATINTSAIVGQTVRNMRRGRLMHRFAHCLKMCACGAVYHAPGDSITDTGPFDDAASLVIGLCTPIAKPVVTRT